MSGYPIPMTGALKQASRQSIQELFNRDPESYTQRDLDDIIYAMRDVRDRLASSTEGKVRQVRVAVPKPTGVGNPDDLGL